MKNRKAISILLSALLIVLAVFSAACESEKPKSSDKTKGLSEKIENKTEAYRTDIEDSKGSLTSNEKIRKYLMNWAETKGIRVKEDDGIVVMNVDGSIFYKDAPPTVIVCPYDANNMSTMNPVITTMYALKNNEETGRLSALFVPEEGHDMAAYEKMKKRYFKKNANIICLNGDVRAIVSDNTGGASKYEFTKELKTTKPKNLICYRVTVGGLKESQMDNKINMKINPIVELNTLLATLKKSSIDYEIASIRAGSLNSLYPGSCVLKITVDEDRKSLFEKRMNARIESFNKRKQAEDPDAVYEYRQISLPDKVITQSDSSRLVAFLYTLLEDEYCRDEESDMLIAVCDTSYIRTKGGKVRIGSTAYSTDELILKEIDEATGTLCELSNFKYKKVSSIPGWQERTENELTERIKKSYSKYTGKDLIVQPSVTPSSAGYVYGLNENCNIISITESDSTMEDFTGALMYYLIGLNEDLPNK